MPRSDTNTRLLIGTLLVASTLTIMVDTAISPALPAIKHHFAGVDNADFWVRLVLVFPSVFVALGAPVVGAVIDRIGRKPVLGVSTVLYGLGGGAGYVLDTIPTLLASRAVLGIGAAGVFVTVTTLISDYFPSEERRDTIFGWQGAFMTFGGVVFLLIGGVLATLGWRVPFLIYAGTLVLLPLIVLVLYEPDRTDDASGTLAADESIRQLLGRVPLGTLALIYAIALIGNVVFFLVPVEVPFYVTKVVNAGSVLTGLAVATTALFAALISTQYTRIRTWLDIGPIVALMFAIMGVGFGIVSLGYTVWVILLGLAVTGVGVGLLVPNLNAWIAADVPEDVRGRVFGGLTSALFLGQFLSPVISSPISAWLSLRLTFRVGGIVLVGLAIVFIALSHRDRMRSSPTERTQQTKEMMDSSVSEEVD